MAEGRSGNGHNWGEWSHKASVVGLFFVAVSTGLVAWTSCKSNELAELELRPWVAVKADENDPVACDQNKVEIVNNFQNIGRVPVYYKVRITNWQGGKAISPRVETGEPINVLMPNEVSGNRTFYEGDELACAIDSPDEIQVTFRIDYGPDRDTVGRYFTEKTFELVRGWMKLDPGRLVAGESVPAPWKLVSSNFK